MENSTPKFNTNLINEKCISKTKQNTNKNNFFFRNKQKSLDVLCHINHPLRQRVLDNEEVSGVNRNVVQPKDTERSLDDARKV